MNVGTYSYIVTACSQRQGGRVVGRQAGRQGGKQAGNRGSSVCLVARSA